MSSRDLTALATSLAPSAAHTSTIASGILGAPSFEALLRHLGASELVLTGAAIDTTTAGVLRVSGQPATGFGPWSLVAGQLAIDRLVVDIPADDPIAIAVSARMTGAGDAIALHGLVATNGTLQLAAAEGTALATLATRVAGPATAHDLAVTALVADGAAAASATISLTPGIDSALRVEAAHTVSDHGITFGEVGLGALTVLVRTFVTWPGGFISRIGGLAMRAGLTLGGRAMTIEGGPIRASVYRFGLTPAEPDGALATLADLATLVPDPGLAETARSLLTTAGLDRLALDGVAIEVDLLARRVSGISLAGALTFPAGGSDHVLRAHLVLPTLTISAELDPSMPIDLRSVAGDHLPSEIAAVLPRTALSRMAVFADLRRAVVRVELEVTGELTLELGGLPLRLRDLDIEIAKEAAGPRLVLAGTMLLDTVELRARVEWQGGATPGWQVAAVIDNAGLSLRGLLDAAASELGMRVPDIVPELVIDHVDFSLDAAGALVLYCSSGRAAAIQLGDKSHDLGFSVELRSTPSTDGSRRTLGGAIEADLPIGDAFFVLRYQLEDGNQVIAASLDDPDGAGVTVLDVLSALGVPPIQDAPGVGFADVGELAELLRLSAASFQLTLPSGPLVMSATSKHFGEAFFVASKGSAGWAFAFGAELDLTRTDGLPAEVADLLRGAHDAIGLDAAALIFSSARQDGFALPLLPALAGPTAGSPITTPRGRIGASALPLDRGITLGVVIDLESKEWLKPFGAVTGGGKLSFAASTDASSVAFQTSLGSLALKVGGNRALVLSNTIGRVQVGATNLLQIHGTVGFDIAGTLVTATPYLTIAAGEITASVKIGFGDAASEGLRGPVGLAGVFLEEADFEIGIGAGGLVLGFDGKGHVIGQQKGSGRFGLVLDIVGEVPNPTWLAISAEQIDIPTAVRAVKGSDATDLPAILSSISARDLAVHWAQLPQVLPDGTTAVPGFGVAGTIIFFGWGGHLRVELSASGGFEGSFETAPIHLAGVLELSGNGKGVVVREYFDGVWRRVQGGRPLPPGTDVRNTMLVLPGGPIFAVRTTAAPFVKVGLHVRLFDLVGVDLEAEVDAGKFSFALRQQVAGLLELGLTCSFSPTDGLAASGSFRAGIKTTVSLVGIKVPIDVEVEAEISLTVTSAGVTCSVRGAFEFEGARLTLPTLTLDVKFAAFSDLPRELLELIEREAEQIFASIAQAFVELAEDIEEAARAIGKATEEAVEEVERDTEKAVKAIGDAAAEASHAVEKTGEAVEAEAVEVAQEAGQLVTQAATKVAELAVQAAAEVKALGAEAAAIARAALDEVARIAAAAEAAMEQALAKVEEIGRQVAAEIKEIARAAEAAARAVVDAAAREVRAIVHDADIAIDAMEREARRLLDEVANFAREAERELEHAGKKVWNAVKHY